ncbi:hypothetical protein [Acetivibrio ethanolgignens]|uniref:Uncharacterized protein n=1 Tax=Acetivibrio ethanolgignens TaxID=290052 RepID=A0A0V8Q9W4_9FIRM|nr:hypothetical protein [Acetivibrio ethanolgignens]KSV57403.1 hypothetical protein ASU35_16370 [Acetivibrio ethanolgignens]
MEIVLVGALMLCVGFIIGMFSDENINKTYYLEVVNIVDNSLKKQNEIYEKYYQNNNESNMEYLDKIIDLIVNGGLSQLRKRKMYDRYTWRKIDEH